MAYQNPLMTELMVPRSPEVSERVLDLYERIGWGTYNSDSPFFTYVQPQLAGEAPPTIAYWQTENEGKIAQFVDNPGVEPSVYARGLRLPNLQELVEVCLVVPSDDAVHAIFEQGGAILERHTHVLPRKHADGEEFRFADPFNYSLRVTANPGWEIRGTEAPRVMSLTRNAFVHGTGYKTRGVGTSWSNLIKFIDSSPDFPLTVTSYEELSGDLDSALEWIIDYRPDVMTCSYAQRLRELQAIQNQAKEA